MRFKGFKTGSRVWGVHSVDSDYDICVRPEEEARLMFAYPDYEVRRGSGGSTIYIREGEKEFNVIKLEDNEYKAWEYATEKLKLHFHHEIADKTKRIFLFKKYCEDYNA